MSEATYFGWDSLHPDFVRGGARVNRRNWLTPKGTAVTAHPSNGDHRVITTDDDGSVYVHDDNGTTAYHQYDDGGSFPRVIGHRDAGGTSRVDAGGDLRRGWMDWIVRLGVSRLAGNISDELVAKRGDGRPVRGRPDHGGDADTDRPTRPSELRGLVTCDPPYHRIDCKGCK